MVHKLQIFFLQKVSKKKNTFRPLQSVFLCLNWSAYYTSFSHKENNCTSSKVWHKNCLRCVWNPLFSIYPNRFAGDSAFARCRAPGMLQTQDNTKYFLMIWTCFERGAPFSKACPTAWCSSVWTPRRTCSKSSVPCILADRPSSELTNSLQWVSISAMLAKHPRITLRQ